MLQAVIFDMDDTLIHWTGETVDWDKLERKHLIDVHAYITQAIHPPLDFDTFVDTMLRRSQTAWLGANDSLVAPSLAKELIGALVDCGVPGDQIDQRACLDAYGWGKLPGTEIFPEVPGVLADLRARGLRLGVLTNAYAPMWMRDVELAEIGIDPAWFDARVSTADVGHLKPSPHAFEYVLDRLDAAPEQAVFIGDNLYADVAGAQGVGMRAIWRTTPDAAPLPAHGPIRPDAVLTSLAELPDILTGWGLLPDRA